MYLNVVNRMHILHGVLHNSPELLEALELPEGRDRVPLHHHVALGEQLYGLQRGSVGTNQTLSTPHKPLLVPHKGLYLDDVTGNIVLKHPYGLGAKARPLNCCFYQFTTGLFF